MRLPQRKKPGDPILAEDWNLLLESIAARTPRPGSGLELIASTGGFYYSARTPKHIQQPGHPPFSVIGIARAGGAYTITLKEGWVIERTPKPSANSAVKFHMPKASGIPLDTVPRPEIAIAIGNTVWCRVKTDTAGVITDPPEIIVSSSDMPGEHYQPENPEDNGTEGTHYITRTELAALGCRVIGTGFNRKGNLNGTECVAGMLDVFREAAETHGADTIVKIDPDMWLGSLGWLPGNGEAGAGFDHRGIWMGCYAMRADVIRRVRRGVLNDQWNCRLPEAFAIGRHLLRLGAVAHPVAGRFTAWMPGIDPAAHDVVLMGRWPRWAREEGMRRLTASLGE